MIQINEATKHFVAEAIKDFEITDQQAIDAIHQAAARAARYARAAVLNITKEYIEDIWQAENVSAACVRQGEK